MAPHKPRKPAPVEYITDEDNMIFYDIEEVETTKSIRQPPHIKLVAAQSSCLSVVWKLGEEDLSAHLSTSSLDQGSKFQDLTLIIPMQLILRHLYDNFPVKVVFTRNAGLIATKMVVSDPRVFVMGLSF
ncbi:hypothetical protein TNCV_1079831 [Trichonephila clavipes]|nr:hypothetical protein TNCV_1079831 [Trichonephila clavipes]